MLDKIIIVRIIMGGYFVGFRIATDEICALVHS
jgi:hypothetical protein